MDGEQPDQLPDDDVTFPLDTSSNGKTPNVNISVLEYDCLSLQQEVPDIHAQNNGPEVNWKPANEPHSRSSGSEIMAMGLEEPLPLPEVVEDLFVTTTS